MRYAIALSVLALAACVDPLPVGTGGPLGPVLGNAPPEAVGPGPFATGGSGGSSATGIGTAVSENDPRLADGFTRFGSELPDSAYVGGQETVLITASSFEEAQRLGLSADTFYGSIIIRDGCGYWVDIYGRRYGTTCT